MKRILFAVMALVLCAALVLSGCQRETAARESYEQNLPQQSDREEAPEQEPYEEQFPEAAQPEKDADWYAEKYIRGLSLQRLEDFETPADLPANDLVAFFFMANYDGENKLPIPEGYRSNTNGALLLPGDGTPGEGHGLLRKLAHFTEFASLGVILTWLTVLLSKPAGLSLAAGFAAACIDETIQMFVPDRGPAFTDVLIDTSGVLTGLILLLLIRRWRRKHSPH